MNIVKMFKDPRVLTGLGVLGYLTTIVLAVRATPKAEALIVAAEDEKGDYLTTTEKIKAGAKPFIPVAIGAVASTVAIGCATKTFSTQNAELAAAYALSQAARRRYEANVEKTLGEEKAMEIKQETQKQLACSEPVKSMVNKLPKSSPAGMHPWYEPLTNQSCYLNDTIVSQTEAALNNRLYTGESYVTVSDLIDELNDRGAYPPLKHTAVSVKLAWKPEQGVHFYTGDKGEWDDGTPCYVLGYSSTRYEPTYVK